MVLCARTAGPPSATESGTIGDSTETSQAHDPVQLFESYGWLDAAEIAEKLQASLTKRGYHVWIDRQHMQSDEPHFALVLQQALEKSRIMVALLSPHSVRGLAHEDQRLSICYNEIREAKSRNLHIVPVKVQEFEGQGPFLINIYRQIQWLDWQQPDAYARGVDEIIDTIENLLHGGKNVDSDITNVLDFSSVLAIAQGQFAGRDWLFSRVGDWLKGKHKCFMIKGMTGSGKTAMAAELVLRNLDRRIVAYHFCTAMRGTLEPAGFVGSIAAMLAHGIEAYAKPYRSAAVAAYLRGSDPHVMLSQGVLAPLREIKLNGSFCIVVDGLDEAMAMHGDSSIPRLLAGALKDFPCWLKLLVTTRRHERIEALFQDADQCVLGEATEDQRTDLRSYVEKRLAEPPLVETIDRDDRDRATRLIEDRSGSSFQYAKTVVDALGEGQMALGQVGGLPKELGALYARVADRRFPGEAGFSDQARAVLGVLLAAREPLTLRPLAMLAGLDEPARARPVLNALSCFVGETEQPAGERTWRIAHSSIRDWLLSNSAGDFRIDPEAGRRRLLEYCLQWERNREPYALKHVVGHLLEAGRTADALGAIEGGLFKERLAELQEPRFDSDDSRNLTVALVGARDDAGIVKLARTASIAQRDGVAAGLQSAPEKDLGFIDGVVGTLLKLRQ